MPKAATSDQFAVLNGTNRFWLADLVTITLHAAQGGTVYRWTGATSSLTVGGQTFSAVGPAIDPGRHRQEGDLTVDTRDIRLSCGDAVLIGGVPLQAKAARDLFRGARAKIERVYSTTHGDASVGAITLFEGRVSNVTIESTSVTLQCASESEVLVNKTLPSTKFNQHCQNVLFDTQCGIVRATWTQTTTVDGVGTPSTTQFYIAAATPSSVAYPPALWPARGYFGDAIVTVGGESRPVDLSTWSPAISKTQLFFVSPFTTAPSVGATVTIIHGCPKIRPFCQYKFDNYPRFRGFELMANDAGAK